MNKEKLLTFIEKYNLGGSVESVKIVSDGSTLKTNFVAEDKTLAGNVTFNDAQLEKCELSVFNTSKLKTFLKALQSEVSITLNKDSSDRLVGLVLADDKTSFDFMLSEASVIPKAPGVKSPKDFDIEIPLDANFIDLFVKAKGALPDVDSFTLLMNKKGDKLELVIGFANINSDRAKVDIKPTAGKDKLTAPISFNANYFKEILLKNSEATDAVFKVSALGISTISFVTTDFEANYFLIKKDIE